MDPAAHFHIMKNKNYLLGGLLAFLSFTSSHASDFKVANADNIEIAYNILSSEDKTIEVTYTYQYSDNNYKGISAITIPETVTYGGIEYTVSQIGNLSFFGCSALEKITLPETIERIASDAFAYTALQDINFPSALRSIGSEAFRSCELPSLDLRHCSFLTALYTGAFSRCLKLQCVKLPNDLQYIQTSAFEGCSALEEVEFPLNLKTIGAFAFAQTAIKELNFMPIGLYSISIGMGAFLNCTQLTSAYLIAVSKIGEGAFSGTKVNLSVPANFPKQNGALYNADMDTLICYHGTEGGEFIVPDGVKVIGQHAFSYNDNITSLIIPNSVETVTGIATNTTALEYIKLPDSISEDEDSRRRLIGFSNNTALKKIILPQNVECIGSSCFTGCSELEEIDLPEGLVSIEDNAFYGTRLKSIRIPSTVKKLYRRALLSSDNIKVVYSDITNISDITYLGTESGENIFGSTDLSNVTLVVPEGKIEEYRKDWNWNQFGIITDNTHSLSLDETPILSTKQASTINVMMTNSTEIIGFQADIVLPAGATVPRNENGELKVRLSNRADDTHSITAELNDNILKIAVVSMSNSPIREHEGSIFNFDIEVTEVDDCTIEIDNIILAKADNSEHFVAPIWHTYQVMDYTPGDVNDDGRISVGDVTAAIDYLVGRTVEVFSFKAADINGDEKITIGDITALIDKVIEVNDQQINKPTLRKTNNIANSTTTRTDFASFSNIDYDKGKTPMLEVEFNNSSPFIAFQVDIHLPEGVSVENNEYDNPAFTLSSRAADHFVTARQIGDGIYRLVAISLNNYQFYGTEGLLFSCPLILENLTETQEISLNNMIIVRPDNTEVDCPSFIGQISAQSSINDISTKSDNHNVYYNIQGTKSDKPFSGLNIVLSSDGTTRKVFCK